MVVRLVSCMEGTMIFALFYLIDCNEFIDDNSYILFEDYYKAFDIGEHRFLFNTLDFFELAVILSVQFRQSRRRL